MENVAFLFRESQFAARQPRLVQLVLKKTEIFNIRNTCTNNKTTNTQNLLEIILQHTISKILKVFGSKIIENYNCLIRKRERKLNYLAQDLVSMNLSKIIEHHFSRKKPFL